MAPYVEKASRIELIVRFFYGIILNILYGLWGLYIYVLLILQFFHILILGRRGSRLYRSTRRYLAALTNVSSYLLFLTDQRPELTPDLTVYFKRLQPEAPGLAGEARFCVNCGSRIQPDAKFCGTCGAKQ